MRCVILLHMLLQQALPSASAVGHSCQSQTVRTGHSGMEGTGTPTGYDVFVFGYEMAKGGEMRFRSVLSSGFLRPLMVKAKRKNH